MDMMLINAADATKPMATYSQAVAVDSCARTLYISGQLGTDMDGNAPGTIEEQAHLAFANLGAQLRAAGMDYGNLVKLTILLADRADLAGVRPAREATIGAHRPATTVVIAGMVNPAWKIEVEGVACA